MNEANPELTLTYTRGGSKQHIAYLTLNRPERSNAYTQSTLTLFEDAIREASNDPHIRAAIVTGAGERAFCAGADLREIDRRRGADAFELKSRSVFDLWARAPWLTIAAVNGAASGGGLELALASDLRVCSPAARFAFPETGLGLAPAAGGMRRLCRAVGDSRAKELILLGRELDAQSALQWGLISYSGEDYQRHAIELAERAASRDPLAVRAAKLAIDAPSEDAQSVALEAVIQALLYERRFNERAGVEENV